MLELGSTTERSSVYVFRTYRLSALRRISPVGRRGRQGVEAVSPQPLCNTPDGPVSGSAIPINEHSSLWAVSPDR